MEYCIHASFIETKLLLQNARLEDNMYQISNGCNVWSIRYYNFFECVLTHKICVMDQCLLLEKITINKRILFEYLKNHLKASLWVLSVFISKKTVQYNFNCVFRSGAACFSFNVLTNIRYFIVCRDVFKSFVFVLLGTFQFYNFL